MEYTKYYIHRFINYNFTSNAYIVCVRNNCIVVDPGSLHIENLMNYLTINKLTISYIILTHEHYDHCMGVNKLRNINPNVKLVTSYFCNQNIQNDRMNLSRYADEKGNGFIVNPANIVINYDSQLNLLGLPFYFLLTPGHSQGSMCFGFYNILFSGDTIIPLYKPVLKLKGGSVSDYYQSLEKLKSIYKNTKLCLYPGHGKLYNNYYFLD